MNEKGLSANLFYHPGIADYPQAKLNELSRSIVPLDVPQYLMTTCATVDEAKAAMSHIKVVSVTEPAIGIAPPVHVIVTEPSKGLRSVTLWTTAYDTKNLVMHYHTMHNRRVRKIDLKKIDFSGSKELIRIPLDHEKKQDIQDVTPTHADGGRKALFFSQQRLVRRI